MIGNFCFVASWQTVKFLISSLMASNRTKTNEYSQLLNSIKSGLIMLQDVAGKGKIKFYNLMAANIFSNSPNGEYRLTFKDLDRKMFEKARFD